MRVYVLPGILGSELHTEPPSPFTTSLLWLGYARLTLGHFRQLALDAAGTGPHPDVGLACTVGSILHDYYGPLVDALRAGLPAAEVVEWPYDWRLRVETTGQQLADSILATVTPGDPCAIVGHSLGGLVARYAWYALAGLGQQDRIRRIVTIGAPWEDGSYAVTLLWHGDDADFQLLFLIATAARLLGGPGFPGQLGYASLADLVAVTATWPSVYQMLPRLYAGFEADDLYRASIYALSAWPADRGLSAGHLAHAAGPWATALASPLSVPPPHVLTCLAGTGYLTPYRLRDPQRLWEPASYVRHSAGDGRVTVAAAIGPGGRRVVGQAAHGDLQAAGWVLQDIAEYVSEVLPVETPVGDQVADPGRQPPTLAAPIGPRYDLGGQSHDC